jgi:tripartite-type tricarboxylate transporter receptor subunit TctC
MSAVRSLPTRLLAGVVSTACCLSVSLPVSAQVPSSSTAATAPANAAQAFPSRPMRILVGFAPGGPTDVVARLVAPRMTEQWGQPVVVDNRPGAGANIAMALAARSAPDGHTILFTSSSIVVNPTLYRKPGFDLFKDLAPVTRATTSPIAVVVPAALPAKNLKEFIALARANPGKFSFGSPGAGTTGHLSCEMIKMMSGIDIEHVPYGGAAPLMTAMISNQVQLGCPGLPPAIPHMRSGAVRALAVTSPARWTTTLDVPTVAESAFAGFNTDFMTGVFVPMGTPAAVIEKIRGEIGRSLALPDVRERLSFLGFEPVMNTPAEFARELRAEVDQYAKVIRAGKLSAD